MKVKKGIKVIALVVVVMVLFSGCVIRGGGLIMDACAPRDMSTFGINVTIDECGTSGHFTYLDKQARIKLHGDVKSAMIIDDPCHPGAVGMVEGVYTDRCGATGAACIFLYDSDQAGAFKCEYFEMDLLSGPLKGYHKEGPMARGNYKIEY